MASQAATPIIFAGQFRHGIDAKHRVTIPADWRAGGGETFYLRVDTTGSYLQVMPPDEFRRLKEKIEALPSASPRERMQAVRQFASESQTCVADKQGRMVLPPEFCTKIGLKGEIVLVGVFDRFEIWNAARWETMHAAETPTYLNSASQLGL
jgi:MraZ protein